jgi:hypothetical protein
LLHDEWIYGSLGRLRRPQFAPRSGLDYPGMAAGTVIAVTGSDRLALHAKAITVDASFIGGVGCAFGSLLVALGGASLFTGAVI